MRTSARLVPNRQSCFTSASRVPSTAIGRIGTPASIATRNAPSRNSPSSPVADRVPSGKIITDTRLSRRSRHSCNALAPDFLSPRSSRMSPTSRMPHPSTGILKKSLLLIHFISIGTRQMRRMSTKLSWFATATYGRRGSAGTLPVTENRHIGLSRLTTTPIWRNVRPAR